MTKVVDLAALDKEIVEKVREAQEKGKPIQVASGANAGRALQRELELSIPTRSDVVCTRMNYLLAMDVVVKIDTGVKRPVSYGSRAIIHGRVYEYRIA